MKIGEFTKIEDGVFEGTVETLTFRAELRFQKVERQSDKAPEYRIYRKGTETEVGAGWTKTSKKGNPYVGTKLDDPAFPHPVWTALVRTDDGYILNWSRPRPKSDPDENGEEEEF